MESPCHTRQEAPAVRGIESVEALGDHRFELRIRSDLAHYPKCCMACINLHNRVRRRIRKDAPVSGGPSSPLESVGDLGSGGGWH